MHYYLLSLKATEQASFCPAINTGTCLTRPHTITNIWLLINSSTYKNVKRVYSKGAW